MVVHWETSLKPLYVKTVWIDGRRHAILSKDDPVAKATSPTNSMLKRTSKNSSPASSPIESPKLVLNTNPLSLRNWEKQKMNAGYQDGYRIERNCFTAGKTEDIIVDRNPLSERVLQWLDLAGRDHIYLGIEDSRPYTTRQNITDEQTKHYKHIEQISKSNERRVQNRSSRKQMRSHKTYRNDSEEDGKHSEDSRYQVYPASYVSDNLQNYAKHSVNNENIDSHYPARMALSANIISFQDDSNDSTESYEKPSKSKKNSRRISTTSSLSLALRNKFNTDDELNDVSNNNFKSEKQSAVVKGIESQYIDMIRKKMSEANYNIKTTKRQLHIFIPSLPKVACDTKESSILTIDDA